MPAWSSTSWLNSPPKFAPGADAAGPVYALLHPPPRAAQVPVDAPVRACVYATSGKLSVALLIQGEVAYSDEAGLSPNYVGFVREMYGRTFIAVAPRAPFAPGVPVNVTLAAQDTDPPQYQLQDTTQISWTFTPAVTTTYAGNQLLEPEGWLLRPLTHFITLEPLRLLMLQYVLDDSAAAITNRDNIAARAIYQLAYESEVSAALNAFIRPDAGALASIISQKRPVLELAQRLEAYEAVYDRAIAHVFTSGAFPREYRNNFSDYFGSLLYNYRVSAVCALILLGYAIENAAVDSSVHIVLETEDGFIITTEDDFELEI